LTHFSEEFYWWHAVRISSWEIMVYLCRVLDGTNLRRSIARMVTETPFHVQSENVCQCFGLVIFFEEKLLILQNVAQGWKPIIVVLFSEGTTKGLYIFFLKWGILGLCIN
jgi:hypothetical protein